MGMVAPDEATGSDGWRYGHTLTCLCARELCWNQCNKVLKSMNCLLFLVVIMNISPVWLYSILLCTRPASCCFF